MIDNVNEINAILSASDTKASFGGPLYQKLLSYSESDYCGFHMPGHKRLMGEFVNPYQIDISEIAGFDDLHHPEPAGILREGQRRAARLFGAEETHYLINGSTGGILSAISACVRQGGTLLMARNCHRSVYHAAELRMLKTDYLYPEQAGDWGINGGIRPESVETALARNPEIEAVMVTSPTYDGVCSDIRAIAEICHRRGKPLLVDQAHGAHFVFSDRFPSDAVTDGADIVIHSLHKTLPSLTQTALLHVQGELADRQRLTKYLSVYQSSSPSYVLMASLDACVDYLERNAGRVFAEHEQRLSKLYGELSSLQTLRVADGELSSLRTLRAVEAQSKGERGLKEKEEEKWPGAGQDSAGQDGAGKWALTGRWGISAFDPDKLLISTAAAGRTGSELADILLQRYHLQMEMAAPTYAVGILSIADTDESYERLAAALREIDEAWTTEKTTGVADEPEAGDMEASDAEATVVAGDTEAGDVEATVVAGDAEAAGTARDTEVGDAAGGAKAGDAKASRKQYECRGSRGQKEERTLTDILLPQAEQCCSLGEAAEQDCSLCLLTEAKGRIAGAYIYLYPPGIPLLAPGERVTEDILDTIAAWQAADQEVHGLVEDCVPVCDNKYVTVQSQPRTCQACSRCGVSAI